MKNRPLPDDSYDPLAKPGKRAELARTILADIDNYCQGVYDSEHRKHLGASIIGHSCSRYIWSVFRWLKLETFSGQHLRLFQRGHLEEARFQEYLKGIGAEVISFNAKTNKQYRIKGIMGHFGGSLDGQIIFPEKYQIPFGMICEYKTKAGGNGFNKLKSKGVKLAAPQHYAQICVYGAAYKYKYALYMCVNKNDDDLHIEIVELDYRHADELKRKAYDIVVAQTPPQKIAISPAYYMCKYCNFKEICFNNEPVEINCRSCKHAIAVENSQWHCALYNKIIPPDYILEGCKKHEAIT